MFVAVYDETCLVAETAAHVRFSLKDSFATDHMFATLMSITTLAGLPGLVFER
jgi:hypothetical protein